MERVAKTDKSVNTTNLALMEKWFKKNLNKDLLHFVTGHVEDRASMWKKLVWTY